MLALSRKVREEIVITTASGERIVVSVLEIDRGRVRLGVEADRAVTVDRGEIDRIKQEATR